MIKRLVWFVTGAAAGIAGAGFAKRKAREMATELAPAQVAKKAGVRLRDAIAEGRRAARVREAELKAALDGRGSTLADELDDGDTVLVDGHPVEPGQVIVLRQVDGEMHAAPRARAAQRHRRRGA